MINISKAVIDIAQNATQVPDWTNEASVRGYLESLVPSAARLIVEVAQGIQSGRIGLVGSADEIRTAVADELEARGLTALDPALIEAIITILLTLVRLLSKRPS
ncbi:hypothetical protein [Thermogutta sp.]|jgi:hypothetical protein|uniref:hypothetical protein n=1 Tax=Thermogutta sp. TaxID=1962930 RepID=UPI00322042BC